MWNALEGGTRLKGRKGHNKFEKTTGKKKTITTHG